MRAIVCCPTCPTRIEMREVAEPEPATDELLVEVAATSLNLGNARRLRWERDGWRPGYDVAGRVLEPAPDGSGPGIGARVAGVLPEGAWAERVAIPSRRVATIPDGLGFAAAAAVPVAGLTSSAALDKGSSLVGRRILVTGAAGGVGRFAVQLGHLGGAHVTASVGRPERARGLEAIGADEVSVGIDADGEPFDLVIESVGGSTLEAALERLAPGGVIVCIGASSDEPATFDSLAFVRRSSVTIYGLQLFDEMERQGLGSRHLGRLLDLVAGGRLDPQIDHEASWDTMAEMLELLVTRRVRGKAVAIID